MHWDYRVVQEGNDFFIAEVVYDDAGNTGWVDNHASRLKWDTYDDLKDTVRLIQQAFDRPLLQVDDDDNLIEIVQGLS